MLLCSRRNPLTALGLCVALFLPLNALCACEPEVEPTPPSSGEDLGKGDGRDVVLIGDSWMYPFIQPAVIRTTGQDYRGYAIPGVRLLPSLLSVPDQYDAAKSENPNIKTVIMTGGGNDIIQVPGLKADCDAGGATCEVEVGKILAQLSTLWAEMAADGVRDVIYIQYATPDGVNVDFKVPSGDGVERRCQNVPAPLRCHLLETVDIVQGDIPDGIHPSAQAAERIADAVYDMMVQKGMRR